MFRKLKWLFFTVVIALLVYNASLISYLLMQGHGQLAVLWNAVPIADFLQNEEVDHEMKSQILLVEEVKSFARIKLGLQSEGLYSTIYDQKNKDILWNLSACEPYALQSVEWTFPIVGCVSYKGFFDLEKAEYEEEQLKSQGYDTRIRAVNAWSTLGWFSDPILSNNLKRSEGRLAELFIHEITHANIFLKDSLTFNENLASFIGEQGAKMFLEQKYGADSEELVKYDRSEEDTQTFVSHCLNGVSELTELYGGIGALSLEKKDSLKIAYMNNWVARLDTIPFHEEAAYHGRFVDKLPNNAFFMAFDRYDSKKKDFAEQIRKDFKDDLPTFINFYKQQK